MSSIIVKGVGVNTTDANIANLNKQLPDPTIASSQGGSGTEMNNNVGTTVEKATTASSSGMGTSMGGNPLLRPVSDESIAGGAGIIGISVIGNAIRAISVGTLTAAGYAGSVLEKFTGSVNLVSSKVALEAYRYSTEIEQTAGRWLTVAPTVRLINSLGISPGDALALPTSNTAQVLTKYRIPADTEFIVGMVRNGAAWAIQIYIKDPSVLEKIK
jgi:hypothetical protein